GGLYLTWNLTGHLTIRVTLTGGPNAVVSGIFFAPPPSATFIGTDSSTQGTWKGFYGVNGEAIPNDSTSYPTGVQVTFTGQTPFTWPASTPDPRAPQKAAATDRIASTWFTSTSFTIDLSFTDGNTHQVALYCLDWTFNSRGQRIDILNPASGAILDSRTISSFGNGQYLTWTMAGHVTVRVTLTLGPNAVVSGLFF